MKVEYKITELDHENLVDFLSTATYGDNTFEIFTPEEFKELRDQGEGDCWEDKLANVLLAGGKLDIVDRGDDEIMPDEVANFQPLYPKHFHHLEKYTDGFENCVYYPVYRIGLEDIIEAAQTDEGYRYAKELWIDEMGDFYTAWNLLQLVIFGEVVYG